jgi:hypothetical protein
MFIGSVANEYNRYCCHRLSLWDCNLTLTGEMERIVSCEWRMLWQCHSILSCTNSTETSCRNGQ